MGSIVLCSMLACTLGQGAPAAKTGTAPGDPDVRCGAFCLYLGLKALDFEIPAFEKFEQELGPPARDGYSLGALAAAAERYGAKTLGVKTTLANLQKRDQRFACIAHVNGDHFVNLFQVSEEFVHIVNPPQRAVALPHPAWGAMWDGTSLLIAREPLVAEEDLPRDISWANLAGYAGLAVGALLLLYIAAWAIKKSGKGKMAI